MYNGNILKLLVLCVNIVKCNYIFLYLIDTTHMPIENQGDVKSRPSLDNFIWLAAVGLKSFVISAICCISFTYFFIQRDFEN